LFDYWLSGSKKKESETVGRTAIEFKFRKQREAHILIVDKERKQRRTMKSLS
jgi:hypothetical protein